MSQVLSSRAPEHRTDLDQLRCEQCLSSGFGALS
jgi:hypothetical protein